MKSMKSKNGKKKLNEKNWNKKQLNVYVIFNNFKQSRPFVDKIYNGKINIDESEMD